MNERNRRLLVAVVVAALAGCYVLVRARLAPEFGSDFDQIWYAARALFSGRDPYAEIGPGRAVGWPWPFYYPLPAVVLTAPLALLPVIAARVAFASVGAGLLAYALARHGALGLVPLMSGAMLSALMFAQWTPLLTAGMLIPTLAMVLVAKPNVGLIAASGMSRVTRAAVVGGAALVLAAFAVQPSWAQSWLAAVREAPHLDPYVAREWGWLLLLAAARWRRPEARVLLATALVPHTPAVHEALPLLVLIGSGPIAAVLAVTSHLVMLPIPDWTAFPSFAAFADAVAHRMILFVYAPALVLLLLRPNEGDLPRWAERMVSRWPSWMRGAPVQRP